MKNQNLTYKEAMLRLEDILENIDNPETSIDELADQVKEATEHLKLCRSILSATERNINSALVDLEKQVETEQDDV